MIMSIMFRATPRLLTIKKRNRSCVKVCSTPDPCLSVSCVSSTISRVSGWLYGKRIRCLVWYEISSVRRRRPLIRSRQLTFVGFSCTRDLSFISWGNASVWVCLIEKVSAPESSTDENDFA